MEAARADFLVEHLLGESLFFGLIAGHSGNCSVHVLGQLLYCSGPSSAPSNRAIASATALSSGESAVELPAT
jgi:hypothetical protein